jgi:hypothetical protein
MKRSTLPPKTQPQIAPSSSVFAAELGTRKDKPAYRWGFSAERQEKLDRPVLSIEVCVKVDLSRERSKTLGSHLQGTDSNTAN